ncbi:MAG: HD domain-containing protein [Candidatus Nomurabacteria bacterium]|nr:HD domain-containing protein [Candidatus Nomurabacteria bacterium]
MSDVLDSRGFAVCEFYALQARNFPRAITARRLGYPDTMEQLLYRIYWQSIDEHSALVARLAAVAIPSEFDDLLKEPIDMFQVAFSGLVHDDAEKITADSATSVDKVAPEQKMSAEVEAMQRIYGKLKKGQRVLEIWQEYEGRQPYYTKLIKMCDGLELVLWLRMLQSNSIGKVKQEGGILVQLRDEWRPIDPRAYPETASYLARQKSTTTATIVGNAVHKRLKQQMKTAPELVEIYEIVDSVARHFNFAAYSPETLLPLWV